MQEANVCIHCVTKHFLVIICSVNADSWCCCVAVVKETCREQMSVLFYMQFLYWLMGTAILDCNMKFLAFVHGSVEFVFF